VDALDGQRLAGLELEQIADALERGIVVVVRAF